ncbi:hypothetical protein [Saccharolobus caldissimus]|uniref:Uncharacterized protein n=1 Tax=Saccharolobus caldissimus TaxID=1702097 RepID=A0AAQ4CTF8_9CREN|nr:hypothetical protein [Saccharolobus caldissimus]BDB99089.1 hypothetical protein SACC_21060 [Saccharolobus caldissimus]
MKFNDDFLLMAYTVSKLKYFTSFRKRVVGVGSMVSPTLALRFVERKTNFVRNFKVGLANLSDLAFSFDGFKVMGDRAWASRKNILVKGVSSARLPVEGSGIKIREGKASATTLRGVVIEVFFLNLYRNLEVLLTRIRTRVLVN